MRHDVFHRPIPGDAGLHQLFVGQTGIRLLERRPGALKLVQKLYFIHASLLPLTPPLMKRAQGITAKNFPDLLIFVAFDYQALG
jgi:hypothetical protein